MVSLAAKQASVIAIIGTIFLFYAFHLGMSTTQFMGTGVTPQTAANMWQCGWLEQKEVIQQSTTNIWIHCSAESWSYAAFGGIIWVISYLVLQRLQK